MFGVLLNREVNVMEGLVEQRGECDGGLVEQRGECDGGLVEQRGKCDGGSC